MNESMTFGAWLRRYRLGLGLTQRAFAENLGYAFSTYRKLEADERLPSRTFLNQLADYMPVSGPERSILLLFGQTGVSDQAYTLLQQTFSPSDPSQTFRSPDQAPQAHPGARLLIFPRSSTPLIGRERDLGELVTMVRQRERRLITLVGPPGVGKTHLVLQTLATFAADTTEFPDGIVFVSLATLAEPDQVVLTIAHSFGLTESDQPLPKVLSSLLCGLRLLLVLDNLEQVLDVGPMLAELLAICPGVTILATSRAPLRVRAEQQFFVSPLEVPNLSRLPDPAALEKVSSVALFVARARANQHTFQLTSANSAAIAALCVQIDGLPLALELAAAHIKFFSPAALLEGITDRLDLLTDGPRDLPVCQQSLRAAIEQSYLLLTASQQVLFTRLAVFVGGATLTAISAICAEQEPPDAAHTIAQLIDQNLVWSDTDDPQRIHMLETIRVYAREQLIARGEYDWMRERHATYYNDWAAVLASRIRSPQQVATMQELERELGNLRAALHWCFEHPPLIKTGAHMAFNLCQFCWCYDSLWQQCLGFQHPTTVQAQQSLAVMLQAVAVTELPEAIRAALQAQDVEALQQALQALPAEEQQVVATQLQSSWGKRVITSSKPAIRPARTGPSPDCARNIP